MSKQMRQRMVTKQGVKFNGRYYIAAALAEYQDRVVLIAEPECQHLEVILVIVSDQGQAFHAFDAEIQYSDSLLPASHSVRGGVL